jgi:hypothetical protein
MRRLGRLLIVALACHYSWNCALAAEGPSIAGPVGGTDVRSAFLPPPGLYGAVAVAPAAAYDLVDGEGRPVAGLEAADLKRVVGGPFILYVPDIKVWGGSVGFSAFVPFGRQCGRLFPNEPRICQSGMGDPYVEASWSRFFGTVRPSRFADAPPIAEGLAVAFGFGAVVPIGQYDASTPTKQALSTGSNIWDFAPSVAVTYTTAPVIADGTEFSAKVYWNNYLTNPDTQHATGSIISVDYAITERIGRFQVGIAGAYAAQLEDDRLAGVVIPPDGRRAEILTVGGVLVYDIPEAAAAVKFKGAATVRSVSANIANSHVFVVGLFKKLR